MQISEIEISKIRPYDKNAKKHDRTQIENVAQSIREFGWQQPIVVDKDYVIIIGHCRFEAAKTLGLKTVPCAVASDLTEEQVKKLRLIDNKTNESDWDLDLLLEEVKELDFSGFDIDWGLVEEEKEIVEDDFDVEAAIPEIPNAKLGDIYQLGNHRLMCGDATKIIDVNKLMQGMEADMILTDPPYNVDYTANGTRDGIENDNFATDEECGEQLWLPAFKNYRAIAKDCCSYICFMPQGGTHMMMMMMMWYKAGWQVKHEFIWKKQSIVLNRADVNYQHEPMVVGWNKKHKFYGKGKFHNTSVWEFDRPTKSKDHPTMKPLDLLGEALLNYTQKDDTVCDFFAGSGSTLLACEILNRKCCAMELAPKYVDVIIARWEQYTGRKAVKING